MNNQSDDERTTATRQHKRALWKTLGLSFLSGFGTPLIKHPDERVAATQQRWAANSGKFMSVALGIDLCVRVYVLRQDPRLCWDIGLIWMVNVFLVSRGQIRSGVPAVGAVGKWSWKTPGLMVAGLALLIPAVVLWLTGGTHSLKAYLGLALLAGGSAFVTLMIMRRTYRKWERRNLGSEAEEKDGDAE